MLILVALRSSFELVVNTDQKCGVRLMIGYRKHTGS